MTHYRRFTLAAVVLLVTVGATTASGQISLNYSLSDQSQIGPIRRTLNSQTPAYSLTRNGVIESGNPTLRAYSAREFDGTVITSVLGGIAGGVVGIGAAMAIIPLSGAEGWDQLGVFALGFLVLEPLGIGIGAHLGNGARGNVGKAIGASYGMMLLGGIATYAVTSVTEEAPIGIIVPILQIGGAVAAERNSMR
jgi:uncharacterized protein YcfJ